MARPLKLTRKVIEKLVGAIKFGSHYETACKMARVHYGTFRRWMVQGEQEDSGIFRELRDAVEQAEAEAEMRALLAWTKAAFGDADKPGDWKAAQEFLARRAPDRWARRDRTELSGPGGGPIEVRELDAVIEQELAELARRAEAGAASAPEEEAGEPGRPAEG